MATLRHRDAGGIEECIALLRRQPLVLFGLAELATNLEANDTAFCCQLLHRGIWHVFGDIVHVAQAVVSRDNGASADSQMRTSERLRTTREDLPVKHNECQKTLGLERLASSSWIGRRALLQRT
jgi:hypothetical protein